MLATLVEACPCDASHQSRRRICHLFQVAVTVHVTVNEDNSLHLYRPCVCPSWSYRPLGEKKKYAIRREEERVRVSERESDRVGGTSYALMHEHTVMLTCGCTHACWGSCCSSSVRSRTCTATCLHNIVDRTLIRMHMLPDTKMP